MKIGPVEILLPSRARARINMYGDNGKDLSGAFAIADTEPLWLAIHQAINELEMETIEAARRYTAETNRCIAAVGASEGVAMVRLRLQEKRNNALRENRGGR
jgi:hypothetical protein